MKRFLIRFGVILLALFLTGCEFEEVTREIGYKGKARLNPWLAAERFVEEIGFPVKSSSVWVKPSDESDVFFVPVGVIHSSPVASALKTWTLNGGHLVLLVEYSSAEWNDWSMYGGPVTESAPPLTNFLSDAGISIEWKREEKPPVNESEVSFNRKIYHVVSYSRTEVTVDGKAHQNIASKEYGDGQITILTDARILRNRNIDKGDHAELLSALVHTSRGIGDVVFLRGAGLSLWRLLGRHLWPVLIGLATVLIVWLWKSFSRFGPVESSEIASPLRGYDHHLEALGDFQWRLDKGSSLLAPIRERIIETGQRSATTSGRRDEDFFQYLAERAILPRERVVRALTESAPADASIMTSTTADLQRLVAALK